jgi:hypothetical protein
MSLELNKSIPMFFAVVAFSIACFPAVYVALGIALPATQTIEFSANVADAASDPPLHSESVSTYSSEGLTFSESLSLPKGRPEIIASERGHRLIRHPHPWLTQFSVALSFLIASAGLLLRSKALQRAP